MSALPFETKEQRDELLSLCKTAMGGIEGEMPVVDLADFAVIAASTLVEMTGALNVAENKHGGDLGERLREALISHFLTRIDGRTLLAGGVHVVELQIGILREAKRRAIIVLEIDPC